MTGRQIDAEQARAWMDQALSTYVQDFETFFLARFLGLSYEYLPEDAPDADKDCCRVTFEVNEMFTNPQGTLHGGIIATVMDISTGHLVKKVAGAGATIEMKIQFMRPIAAGRVTCEGRFVRRGRSISFMESRIFGPDGKLAGLATSTWKMP